MKLRLAAMTGLKANVVVAVTNSTTNSRPWASKIDGEKVKSAEDHLRFADSFKRSFHTSVTKRSEARLCASRRILSQQPGIQ